MRKPSPKMRRRRSQKTSGKRRKRILKNRGRLEHRRKMEAQRGVERIDLSRHEAISVTCPWHGCKAEPRMTCVGHDKTTVHKSRDKRYRALAAELELL